MPAELKEKLQVIAKRNGRSLNSEIVRILEEYVTPPKIEPMPELSEEDLNSPQKLKDWVKELHGKISVLEKVFQRNFPDSNSDEDK